MRLSQLKKDDTGVIAGVSGEMRFVSRATSIGLTPGCRVRMIKNEKNRPLLVYSRDTMISLSRLECDNIEVEVKNDG